ncbi:hypothetical protein OQJ26_11570 [Legionella sp. PATHC038]|uniref:hypothetical protein n=1 Tax=Legionella sheltonii TaxID=2992041 RepID=UPI002243367D|nr:hypothetical protein [Legionella sp. PATHC038]MCW8399428.1 hypothetical protein [Legionella sp. PATHC038]
MKKIIVILSFVLLVTAFIYFVPSKTGQSMVMPGELSAAHAELSQNCSACHTPIKGVDDTKCISCHAYDKALLQRQPSSFHGFIGHCSSCHVEHQGRNANLNTMDHEALIQIAEEFLSENTPSQHEASANHPLVSATESQLSCVACHGTKDKHFGLFGENCAQCHATTQWSIPHFKHPSVHSQDCAQCHKAPPSHYMEHFVMISQKVAHEESANVTQCYLCHQTTSFNDIKGVGFYKHH